MSLCVYVCVCTWVFVCVRVWVSEWVGEGVIVCVCIHTCTPKRIQRQRETLPGTEVVRANCVSIVCVCSASMFACALVRNLLNPKSSLNLQTLNPLPHQAQRAAVVGRV
jgi:hypothetical protein